MNKEPDSIQNGSHNKCSPQAPYKNYPLKISQYTTPRDYAFRTNPPIVKQLPFQVLSVGHYTYPQGHYSDPLVFPCCHVYWGIKGQGRFWTGKGWSYLKPEHVYMTFPGEEVYLEVMSQTWTYSLIALDHKDITRFITAFGLTDKSYKTGPCPEQIIYQIRHALEQKTEESERQASLLAYEFLMKMAAMALHEEKNSLIQQCHNEIHSSFNNPTFDINLLSQRMNIPLSTLSRKFKNTYNISPGAYLQHLRLQYGLGLLCYTTNPIQDVAIQSGFASPVYFSLVVKKETGLSPEKYRKEAPHQRTIIGWNTHKHATQPLS